MSIKYGSKEFDKEFGPLNVADLLQIGRADMGLNQVEMADELGISKQRLCDYEKSRRLPSPQSLALWAEKFQYSKVVWLQVLLEEQLRRCDLDYEVSVKERK